MKNKLVIVALVCLTALCLSVPVLAQGELSLEGLAEQLQALTDKVTVLTERTDSLTDRVDFIESLWVNSESTILLDGSCVVGSQGGVQDATVLSFKETFDEWPNPNSMSVTGVSFDPETGIIGIQYRALLGSRQATIEFWQGCEFLENTDWWEEDYSDGPFEGYVVPTE